MSLDKDKILSELNSVMSQLQSADCGCMDKLFANHQPGMRSCQGGGGGCCRNARCFAAAGDQMMPMVGRGNSMGMGNPMAMEGMGNHGNPMAMGGMVGQGNPMAMGGMGGQGNPMVMEGMGGQGNPIPIAGRGNSMAMGNQGNHMAMGGMGGQGNPMAMGGMGGHGNPMGMGVMGGQGNPMGGHGNPMAMEGMGAQGNPMAMGGMGAQGNPMAMGGQGNPMGAHGNHMGGQGNPMAMGGHGNPMGGQGMPMVCMNPTLAAKNMQMYKDTYNYLNKNLMQPTVKEVMQDLSTLGGVVNSPKGGQPQGGDSNAMSGSGPSSGMTNQGAANPGVANMSMENHGNAGMSHGGQGMAGNIMGMMSEGENMGGGMQNQGGMMRSNPNVGAYGQHVEARHAHLGQQNMMEPVTPNMSGGNTGMTSGGQSMAEQIMGSMTTASEKRRMAQGGGMSAGGMEMSHDSHSAGMHEHMHPGHGGMPSGMHAGHAGQGHNMHADPNMMRSDQNSMQGHPDMGSPNAQHMNAMNAQAHPGMVQEGTGNPNAMTDHPGMMRNNPTMMQGNAGMIQGNAGMMQGHAGMMQGGDGMTQGSPKMAQPAATGNTGPQQGNIVPGPHHLTRNPCPRHGARGGAPGLTFNQLTPGANGITEELGFDPMEVAMQMNPENHKLAAVNTMNKLMNNKGFNNFVQSFMGIPPTKAPATPGQTPIQQLQQPTQQMQQPPQQMPHTPQQMQQPSQQMQQPPQQIQQPPQQMQQPPQELQQSPRQMQQPNQQISQEMQQQQMIPEHHQQMSHEQHQQLTPEQHHNMQMEYQQMQQQQQAHPDHHQMSNTARPAEVYEPYPNQINTGIHLKRRIDPLYPAMSKNYIPRHVEKPIPGEYDLNALGQPIQYVPTDRYYPIPQPTQQTLSPEPVPSNRLYPHAYDPMKQSYVKSTISKTSIVQPRRSVARLPSRTNLNVNRGSHSATVPTSGGAYPQQISRSDGRLYMADPTPPQQVRPLESVSKVAGDATSGQPNSIPPEQLQQITGQPDGIPLKDAPSPFPIKGKLNGLQDKNYGNIPNVSWSFGSRRISMPKYVR